MEVLRLNQGGKLTTDEVLRVFLMMENYLFHRNICEVPTNALNKIFLNLNRKILRHDGIPDRYLDKMAYTHLSKRDSGRFPDDEEFSAALSSKQVYLMRGKYNAYLFERFENDGTVEVMDVFRSLDNNTYTIEHIMPQHLMPEWIWDLGSNYEKIHAECWSSLAAGIAVKGFENNSNPVLKSLATGMYAPSAEGGTAFFSPRLPPICFYRPLIDNFRDRLKPYESH